MVARGVLFTLTKWFNWKSHWWNTFFYKHLLYRDLIINAYLCDIFFKLRLPTSDFLIKYYFDNIALIECNIYVGLNYLKNKIVKHKKFRFWKHIFVIRYKLNKGKNVFFFFSIFFSSE